MEKEMNDNINPSHYQQGKYETIDVILDVTRNLPGNEASLVGNILKYISRYKFKNGIEDVKKAEWYIKKLLEVLGDKNNMSLDDYADKIEKWAVERNLHTAEPSKQMLKVTEEIGELAEGIAKNDRDKIVDGIGDGFVTLIVLARQLEIDFRECVFVAYEEIRHRKGKMVNGVFVKESDL